MEWQSQDFKSELLHEVQVLGEESITGISGRGEIYSIWLDSRVLFSGRNRAEVLKKCVLGGNVARQVYQKALGVAGVLPNVIELINKQLQSLNTSHDELKKWQNKKTT